MPRVERYGGRKVGTDALQGGRRTAAETALSMGAGLAQAEGQRAEALAGFGQTVFRSGLHIQQVQREEQDWADRVALDEARVKLGKWGNQRLYDPNTGALTIRGKDAMPLPEQVSGEFNQVANEIEAGLGNAKQRALFQRIKAQEAEGLDGQLRRHVFTEMRAYEAGVVEATVETAHETAIANAMDPRRVGIELNKAVTAIQGAAKTQGWSPEVVAKKVADVQSATHEGVINNLLASGQDKAAKVYFEEAGGQLTGLAATRVKKALEEGSLRGEAQQKTDEILASGGTLTEQREAARGIDDPQLRDQVMQRLEHEASVRAVADREKEEATLTDAYNILDRTHDVRNIPPATWTNLSGSARSALRGYAGNLAAGTAVQTDWATYYELQTLGSNEATRNDFAKTNLLEYRGKLGNTEFKQLADLQKAIRSGDDKRATELVASEGEQNAIANEALASIGMDPTPSAPGSKAYDKLTAERVVSFRRMFREAVAAKESQKGNKKLTTEELQSIADTLVAPVGKRLTETHWYGDTSVPSFAFEQPQAQVAAVADVPASERRRIEAALSRNGRAISDAEVLRYFNLQLQVVRGDRGRR